jgi:hypothetical protein
VNQQTLLAAVLWANTLFVIHLLTYTWSRRQAPAAKAVTFALLAFAIYSGGYAAQIMSVEPTVIRFWIKVQYVGIVALPPLWLLICMRYTNTSFYSKYRQQLAVACSHLSFSAAPVCKLLDPTDAIATFLFGQIDCLVGLSEESG